MKIYIVLFSVLFFTCYSCSEDILDIQDQNNLNTENWYKTKVDFENATNACYIPLMSRAMFGHLYNVLNGSQDDRILFEVLGADMLLDYAPSDEHVEDNYHGLYQGIYYTTQLLIKLNEKGVDGIDNMTQEDYNYMVAQAKALRGMYYFYLTILYDAPPFYNETTYNDDYLVDSGNGERFDIWNQIEKDLLEASEHLKLRSELKSEDWGRITKGAALSQLGKALLFKHYYYYERDGEIAVEGNDVADLEKAKTYFLEVINSGEYELIQPQEPKAKDDYLYALLCNSAWTDLVTAGGNIYESENNKESIWEVQYSNDPYINTPWHIGYWSTGNFSDQWYSPHPASYKNWEVHPALYFAFETEGAPTGFDRDPRCDAAIYMDGDLLDFDPASTFTPKTFSSLTMIKRTAFRRGILQTSPKFRFGLGVQKCFFPIYYNGFGAPNNSPNNKRIIRYADVLLMYAEVMYLLGDDGTGLEALNQVRRRVDMPDVNVLTADAIVHERDVELCFEGHRFRDLIRWNFSTGWNVEWETIDWGINAENSVNPFVVGKHEFFPYPTSQIDVEHGLLKQNPGY